MQALPRYTLDCYPDIRETQHLAGIAGIRDDLREVLNYCSVLEGQIKRSLREPIVWDALCSAAVIAYVRAYDGGVRGSVIPELLANAPQNLREAHEFFKALRDKHIAHSVNSFEENKVVVWVEMEGRQPQNISDVEIQSIRFIAIDARETALFRTLIEWLIVEVDAVYERERAHVLVLLQAHDLAMLIEQRGDAVPAFLKSTSISHRRRHK